jgi:DNA polymerase-3 subunit chi
LRDHWAGWMGERAKAGMGDVWFYHLTQTSLEEALAPLILRSLAQGWRVELRGRTQERMALLDVALWLGSKDPFLPHGLAGGPHDALQPVLLTTGPGAGAFGCVIAVEGADLLPGEVAALERSCILFDGSDAGEIDRAREQWRLLTAAGIGARYWAEEGGRWTMKRESPTSA